MEPGFDVVTGAFSYTGPLHRAQAARRRPPRAHPHQPSSAPRGTRSSRSTSRLSSSPIAPPSSRAFAGPTSFYNTYWVRFRHGGIGFGDAVANTRILMSAAAEAGVRKVVHISVSNPSLDSHLDYYAGKARTEEIVRESGLQWAIVRPTLIFGPGDILINNIAWLLRKMPIFVIPESGRYRVQPVAGEDVAEIATWAAAQTGERHRRRRRTGDHDVRRDGRQRRDRGAPPAAHRASAGAADARRRRRRRRCSFATSCSPARSWRA